MSRNIKTDLTKLDSTGIAQARISQEDWPVSLVRGHIQFKRPGRVVWLYVSSTEHLSFSKKLAPSKYFMQVPEVQIHSSYATLWDESLVPPASTSFEARHRSTRTRVGATAGVARKPW